MRISQKAFDMCVAEEVTSKDYYTKHYQRPEWPGLSSGVTVGIGYDLGQATRAKISQDWSGLVDQNMLLVMLSCSGLTGTAGKTKCADVKSLILIPWDVALKVFAERDVPQWTAAVLHAVPGSERLTPSCLGVLFDTAYNRGVAGFNSTGERYRELKAIRDDVETNRLSDVPAQFRSMKRLWPNTAGLLRRCDHRIALWEYGMHELPGTPASVPMSKPDIPLKKGSARTKPSKTTNAQNSTAGAIVVGGGAVAAQFSLVNGIFIFVAAVAIAAVVWTIWYRNRNPK